MATQPDFATELALLRQRIGRLERWRVRLAETLPLAVGVAVLLAVWSGQSALGERVARLEATITAHAAEADRRFDAIDRRFDDIDRKIDALATAANETRAQVIGQRAALDAILARMLGAI